MTQLQSNFYPPQMVARRTWNPNQQAPMMNVRAPPAAYQLMPINGNQQPQQRPPNPNQAAGAGGGQGGRGRGGRGRANNNKTNGRRGQGPATGQTGGAANSYKYTANARNQALAPQQQQQQQHTIDQSTTVEETPQDPNAPLTIKALASAPEEQRKQMLGERLFPLIAAQQPMLAGKITGMLLEMDNGELIHLLESENALNDKINEALAVLQQSQEQDDHQDHPDEDKPSS